MNNLYEVDELLEDDKEDDMWQVEIYARLKADNGQYFTTEELLFKIHNLIGQLKSSVIMYSLKI